MTSDEFSVFYYCRTSIEYGAVLSSAATVSKFSCKLPSKYLQYMQKSNGDQVFGFAADTSIS